MCPYKNAHMFTKPEDMKSYIEIAVTYAPN